MTQHIGVITAVEFGRPEIVEEYDDGLVKLEHHLDPGTFTLTVTGLPDDMLWTAGMSVTITPKETP